MTNITYPLRCCGLQPAMLGFIRKLECYESELDYQSSSKRNLVKRVVTMMGAMTTAQAATIVLAYLRSKLDKFSKSKFFLTTRLQSGLPSPSISVLSSIPSSSCLSLSPGSSSSGLVVIFEGLSSSGLTIVSSELQEIHFYLLRYSCFQPPQPWHSILYTT